MPKVGGKKFPYTKAGMKAAKAYAVKRGMPVQYDESHMMTGASRAMPASRKRKKR